MRIHERRMSDQSVLQLLERDREEVTRSLANIMKAIERGIFNETTKARMDELEQQRSEIDDKIAIEQCKHQNRLTKDKVINYLTDPLRQAPRRLIRALIEKIIVFDDKIQIFFKYTKTSPEDNPWEMPAYPGSDSSNMVDLRRILRANRAIFPFPTPCTAFVPKLRFGVNRGMASPCLRSHLISPQTRERGLALPVPAPFLVDLRRIELRSYKVRLRTLHA